MQRYLVSRYQRAVTMSERAKTFRLPDLIVPVKWYRAVARTVPIIYIVQLKSPVPCIQYSELVLTFSLAVATYREPRQSSLSDGALLLQEHLGKVQLVEVRAHAKSPPCLILVSLVMMVDLGLILHAVARVKSMQDADESTVLGTVSTQGNPSKRIWDAALLLHSMRLLQFEVSTHTFKCIENSDNHTIMIAQL